jgi:transcriptional regulator with XRE-family HTH domain
MTDTKKLRRRIDLSGLKRSYIAKALGISPAALYQKIANKQEFRASEIDALCKLLGITSLREKEAIFFAEKVA